MCNCSNALATRFFQEWLIEQFIQMIMIILNVPGGVLAAHF